jgi:O-antigen/teichoic acid export membrane protein
MIRNIFFSSAGQIWTLALALLLTPYIVHGLGPEAYSVLSMAWVVAGYFAFLNLGFGPAVIKYISQYHARGDKDGVGRTLGTATILFLFAGVAGAFLMALATGLFVRRLLHVPAELIPQAQVAFYLAAGGFMVNMALSVFGAVPKALERFDIANGVHIAMSTLTLGASVGAIKAGYGLNGVMLASISVSCFAAAVSAVIAVKLLPGVNLTPHFDKPAFKELFRFSGFILLGQITNKVMFNVDKLLIGVFLPISQLTYYVVPFGIASRMLMFQGMITPVIFPLVSRLKAHGDDPKLYEEVYIRSSKLVAALTLPVAAALGVYADPFLLFWMGPEFAANGKTTLLLVTFAFASTSMTCVPTTVSQALGAPEVSAKFSFIHAILNVALWLAFIPRFGIAGAAAALAVSHMIIVPWSFMYLHGAYIRVSLTRVLAKAYLRPVTLVLTLSALFLPAVRLVGNLIGALISMAVFCLIYYAVAYFLVFDGTERAYLKAYISKWR